MFVTELSFLSDFYPIRLAPSDDEVRGRPVREKSEGEE
jgi:hypothetical protein